MKILAIYTTARRCLDRSTPITSLLEPGIATYHRRLRCPQFFTLPVAAYTNHCRLHLLSPLTPLLAPPIATHADYTPPLTPYTLPIGAYPADDAASYATHRCLYRRTLLLNPQHTLLI